MPLHGMGFDMLPMPDQRATLDRMPGSSIPVLRQPFEPGDMLPLWASSTRIVGDHHLYDLDLDPYEQENRAGEAGAREMTELLVEALRAVDAPAEQFARLGLPA
jgi:hypothetical protein